MKNVTWIQDLEPQQSRNSERKLVIFDDTCDFINHSDHNTC